MSVLRALAWASWNFVLLACSVGCNNASNNAVGGIGQARLAIESTIPRVTSVDYTLRFYWLDVTPPLLYNEVTLTSARPGGELISVLPCRTSGETGINQIQVSAVVHLEGQADPIHASAAAVFTCRRNADTAVNVVVSLGGQLDAGFADVDVTTSGVLCASKVDTKGDSFVAVCPTSSCDPHSAVFLFANTCQTLSGAPPSYWACGPGEWTLIGGAANVQYPISPVRSETVTFGVTAVEPLQLASFDPTLTDSERRLLVWRRTPSPRALLETQLGRIVRSEIDRARLADFVAELLAPAVPGVPLPRLLAIAMLDAGGTTVTHQTRFGRCDLLADGTSRFAGLWAIDARLMGASQVKLLFSATGPNGLASKQTICRTTGVAGIVGLTCDPVTNLQ